MTPTLVLVADAAPAAAAAAYHSPWPTIVSQVRGGQDCGFTHGVRGLDHQTLTAGQVGNVLQIPTNGGVIVVVVDCSGNANVREWPSGPDRRVFGRRYYCRSIGMWQTNPLLYIWYSCRAPWHCGALLW